MRTDLWTGEARTYFREVYEAVPGPMIPRATLQGGLQQVDSGPSPETMTVDNGGLNQ